MIAILAQVTPDVSTLESLIPAKYAAYASALIVVLTTLGRAITALKNDPGVMSVFKSIFMGSSTTTAALPNKAVAGTPAPSGIPKSAIALLLCAGLVGFTACQSAVNTAYQAEAAGFVTLQGCAAGYKGYKAANTVSAATDAKAQALFASAKAAELAAIDASIAVVSETTNTAPANPAAATAAATQALSDLSAFLTSIGVKL